MTRLERAARAHTGNDDTFDKLPPFLQEYHRRKAQAILDAANSETPPDERKRFEEWVSSGTSMSPDLLFKRLPDGDYFYQNVSTGWRAWEAAAQQRSQMLSNLLAVIHRDGGHYEEKHGTEQAVKDAMTLSSERLGREE